jgi:predicted ArsR family transcriptional regulator
MTPQGVTRLQEQARALGDPTRYAIFRYVADAPAELPVGIAELTAHLGLNHNAIRQHLAKLCDAELVVEGKAQPSGRGRPRLVYRVEPTADSRWGVVGPYERLSVMLAEVLRSGEAPVDVGRRSVAVSESVAGALESAQSDPVQAVVDVMARDGFEPVVFRRAGGESEIVLQSCPFAAAAETDPATVCALHLGIAEGVADLTGGRVVVDDLIANHPRRAQCRLHLRTVDDDVAAGAGAGV